MVVGRLLPDADEPGWPGDLPWMGSNIPVESLLEQTNDKYQYDRSDGSGHD